MLPHTKLGQQRADGGLRRIFADLHLHIGQTSAGEPVKISASRRLTFREIAHEAAVRKGISLLGVIDAHVPGVQHDIMNLLDAGEMAEAPGGGIRFGDTTIVLGSEIEVYDAGTGGPAHHLIFLPRLADMQDFTSWLERHMRNVNLSSQRIYVSARELQAEVKGRGGLFIPAHIFTPHKSLLGSATERIADVLEPSLIDAVELGLSADSRMAGWIEALDYCPFLTNSDAHSLSRIGREYNAMLMAEPSFEELCLVLQGSRGRRMLANYGLDPRLGKYHRTWCKACGQIADGKSAAHERCEKCGSPRLVRGVMDRIEQLAAIAGRTEAYLAPERPPYLYQVPLEFMPGVGPVTLEKLLGRFGTEMDILHHAPLDELSAVAGAQAAALIAAARAGELQVSSGGGGRYGKVDRS
ncbi:endonuclease Q family protein [Paenibacillus sp. 1P07SE]|uniref:endonuclease Q family protein n=1 Tax=Paenibacillus sp. 1P07SE TaxID=3132209 RepID=UPI0039A6F6B9